MLGRCLKSGHLILFAGYVLLANLLYNYVRDDFMRANFRNDLMGGPFAITWEGIGLSLLGGILFCLPAILGICRAKGRVKVAVWNLAFGAVCLILALSRIWVFTVLARVPLSDFLAALASPVFLELLMPFCAVLLFVQAFSRMPEEEPQTS